MNAYSILINTNAIEVIINLLTLKIPFPLRKKETQENNTTIKLLKATKDFFHGLFLTQITGNNNIIFYKVTELIVLPEILHV